MLGYYTIIAKEEIFGGTQKYFCGTHVEKHCVRGIRFIQMNKSHITLSYLTQVEAHSHISIIRLMGSVMVWPKVIT
jgi:hypothetical protein